MHPAPSVIAFTTLSGLGFGLLVFLGLGQPTVTGWTAFWFFLIAHTLAVGGLLASTFHLGRPERALKAFTQWQTSWLSREAWAAVAALVTMGLYAAAAVFLGTRIAPLGLIGAALSLGTVFTTAMIYAQLKTVPRWNQVLTPLHFLSASLGGGALLAGQITPAAGPCWSGHVRWVLARGDGAVLPRRAINLPAPRARGIGYQAAAHAAAACISDRFDSAADTRAERPKLPC